MNIKSLLFGSAAALVAVTGARAADAVVVAEPEPVEYVKVCDAYGSGFYYIPGTETCLKISGYVRNDTVVGKDPYDGSNVGDDNTETFWNRTRFTLRTDARTETELGTLKSYAELRFNFTNGSDAETVDLNEGYIELGGFRIGAVDSQFTTFTGYLGDIINDDVVAEGRYVTNQVSYTFAGGNGFSATVGLEQGNGVFVVDDYTPHVVAGAKFEQAWGAVSAVGGYDSVTEEWAGKLRLDVKFSDTISAWVLGGYKSDGDKTGYFGTWNGDYAVWGGAAFKVSDKATVNAQVAYEDAGKFAAALNVGYELVPGFRITPEINYTKFDDGFDPDDAFAGVLRFQRNF
ncbi:porin [Phyllobacterium endophyticum]|uniref:porin n=1 Tax=Phyllobacterium endophyticum TaxID=1149773 RepID=UPI0011CA80A9|nr:porin [Phyllobacterium endophyticum]TXR46896.1 porin [Phyllobacterium endophyticum]